MTSPPVDTTRAPTAPGATTPPPAPPRTAPRRRRGLGGLIERIVANRILMQLMTAVTLLAVLIYGTATFPLRSHVVLSLLAMAVAIVVTRILPEYRLISVVLSVAISLRYIIWRGLETLNLDTGFGNGLVSLLLYGAECYTVFVLVGGYFQTTLFLDRRPAPIPLDVDKLPSVDVFIPTYNEPVEIVRRTLVSAMAMDYPKKRVYLLDDGRRAEMKSLAEEVGAGYITRPDNSHAKAGNINHALRHTDGELVAFFDADHAPVRSFLQLTVGFFLENDNLSLAQTPHHFYNPDPFERNLYTARRVPPEQNLFYHLVQVSNDFWNSAFFCGSCAVIRRVALEDIGGMAVETVTEDAHTALKMQARGWDTAYLNIPQAAGLATESFSAYVGQRIRWARGMAQILRMDPPLLKRGLSWFQRVNYTFAASHFFFGVPRVIFLVAPITYLLLGFNPLQADVYTVLLYAVPHLFLAYINASAVHRNQRHTFWPEVYETAMAPYSALVTTTALLFPKRGTFNVTPKGARTDRVVFDVRVSWFNLVLTVVSLAAVVSFYWRLRAAHPDEHATLWVALVWSLYNLVLLAAALAAAIERPQRRTEHRIPVTYPVVAIEHGTPGEETQEDDALDELDEDSYAPVESVDPVEVYYDAQDELARRHETSEASFASDNRPVPSLIPEQDELAPHVWRASGQTIDLTERGVRFLLPKNVQVPKKLRLTFLGDDGSRTTVLADALAAWPVADGTVVRARFRHLHDGQVHQLIKLMFTDPNAWSRSRYTMDRPLSAFLTVATAPLRAIGYALGLKRLQPPSEHAPLPADAREVHRPVLQCFHCGGILLRPLPVCPHCGEPLSALDEEGAEVYEGTFDRAGPTKQRRPTPFTYLIPAFLVAAAFVLAVGWQGFFETPASAESPEAALELAHRIAAEKGEVLATELLDALHATDGHVPPDWGSRISHMRLEYPRVSDPRDRAPVHVGPVAAALGELLGELHALESQWRRKVPPANLETRVKGILGELRALQR